MITPKLDTIADIPLVEYPGSLDEAQAEGCENFVARHPEYYQSDWNAGLLLAWLKKRRVPATLKNLEIAHCELSADGMLEKEPAAPTPAPPKITTVPVEGGSAVMPPTDEERSLLEKTKDDPTLTDHARKKRDELLRRAAVASRITNSRLRSGEDPQILI